MQRQFRCHLPGNPDDAHILDDDAVHPDVAQKAQVFPHCRQFLVIHQGIYGDVDPHPMQVGKTDGPGHFLGAEVICISPSAEVAASQIHRVRAGEDSGLQGFPGAGRCQ